MVKKALYGCMHAFLYDAHTNGSNLFTISQKLLIYTCNINLEAVQYMIEREFTTNLIISSEFIKNIK